VAAQGWVDGGATLGSSDGTVAQGLGESWGVQRRLREGAKERLRLRRSWGSLGVWVTRATDAAHPTGSLQLAQIGARGGFLEGSRRGQGQRAGSDWMWHGGEGPGAEERPWRIGLAKQRRCGEEGDDPDLWGHRVSASREEEGARCWPGPGQVVGPGVRGRAERGGRTLAELD
jgi:hypothetical protein